MPINEKEVKKLSAIILMIVLVIAAFLVLRPIFLAIITGLLLAYVINPVFIFFNSRINKPTLSASIVCAVVVLVLIVPLWFFLPIVIRQVFDMFNLLQGLDVSDILTRLFSNLPQQFISEVSTIITNFIYKSASSSINFLVNFIVELPQVLLQLAVVIFVFFFTLRDQEKLKTYVSELSPLNKTQEKLLIKEFKEITSSIIFGYVIIGILQGIATGIGLLIFGVPRALLLTVLAVFSSIFPLFGPWLIWVPAAIFLFAKGNLGMAVGFTVYSVLIVSSLDNILRPYIVARRSSISSVVALVGMIGGLIVFGLIGVILGPLILAYLIIFLTAYKNKTLSSMFSSE